MLGVAERGHGSGSTEGLIEFGGASERWRANGHRAGIGTRDVRNVSQPIVRLACLGYCPDLPRALQRAPRGRDA